MPKAPAPAPVFTKKPVATKKVAAKKGAAVAKPKRIVTPQTFAAHPKSFHIGGDIAHKTDLSRYVKWPRYVALQRKQKIMMQRLKTPAQINQFTQTLDKHDALELFKLLHKYKPETKKAKKERLTKMAEEKKAGVKEPTTKKPMTLKFGLNHVTSLVEAKKAQMVIIAHDVTPIELVLWMPTLCRKMNIPYCIVKGKARLGALVGLKTATVVALTEVKAEDKAQFENLQKSFTLNYNDRSEIINRTQGGGKLGLKSSIRIAKRKAAIEKAEKSKKAQ